MSFMAIGSFASAAFFPIAHTWMINRCAYQLYNFIGIRIQPSMQRTD